jgi:hypothetical protein
MPRKIPMNEKTRVDTDPRTGRPICGKCGQPIFETWCGASGWDRYHYYEYGCPKPEDPDDT